MLVVEFAHRRQPGSNRSFSRRQVFINFGRHHGAGLRSVEIRNDTDIKQAQVPHELRVGLLTTEMNVREAFDLLEWDLRSAEEDPGPRGPRASHGGDQIVVNKTMQAADVADYWSRQHRQVERIRVVALVRRSFQREG